MELLRELLDIQARTTFEDLFEDLGNIGKLGLGHMVNAFKQSYSISHKHNEKMTGSAGSKFTHYGLGKDSESVDVGGFKGWVGFKKLYAKEEEKGNYPLAAIFLVDKKPVSLLIATSGQFNSVNDKVALAWDFSKISPTDDEEQSLVKGLNTDSGGWRSRSEEKTKSKASSETSTKRLDSKREGDGHVEFFVHEKYSGYTQTVREVKPYIENLATTFGSRLEVKLILADKVANKKRGERRENPAVDPKNIKLFTDSISIRLAKFKNSKIETAEDADAFVNKVFSGTAKKINFAGATYSAIPSAQYTGSADRKHQGFYNSTMKNLFSGKAVDIEFEADRKAEQYQTLYLTIKLVNGTIKPVKMRYTDKDSHKTETITF